MKLGQFEIPEIRLIPKTFETLDEIYKVKKREKIQSKDLAIFLGFKYGTEPHYYRKIRALTEFGLMEGKGVFHISELGEKLLHPRDDAEKKLTLTKSVLNIPLWKEIYQKHGKKPREDNFWAVLMDITKIDPDTAKNSANKILGWYMMDINYVSDSFASQDETTSKSETLRSSQTQDTQMSQQMGIPKLNYSNDVEILSFDKYQVALPKGDLSKEWNILKSYMDIKLKNYKYEKLKTDLDEEENIEEPQEEQV